MKRRLLALIGATHVALAACSAESSSGSTQTAPPTITDAGRPPSSGGAVPPGVGPNGVPAGCPSERTDSPASDIDEATFRERIVGIHRVCAFPDTGIEIRVAIVDTTTSIEGLVWYQLDARFVRTGEEGRIELRGCEAGVCTVDWIAPTRASPVEETTTRTLSMWTDPVAVQAEESDFPAAWVRVAD